MNTRNFCTGMLLTGSLSQFAFADNWQPLTGADTLREFAAALSNPNSSVSTQGGEMI